MNLFWRLAHPAAPLETSVCKINCSGGCPECDPELNGIGSRLSVPGVGDWVVFTPHAAGKPQLELQQGAGPALILRYGQYGMIVDYMNGGPEYPPCLVVVWSIDGWWHVSKHLPEELSLYKVGI